MKTSCPHFKRELSNAWPISEFTLNTISKLCFCARIFTYTSSFMNKNLWTQIKSLDVLITQNVAQPSRSISLGV